jgi:competence protein ComEA
MAKNHRQHDHSQKPAPERAKGGLLRWSDQAVVAGFVCVGLIGLICWIVRLDSSGEVIELEQATERHASYQIDINQAEWVEWAELPGLGKGTAERIVESRETEGPFTSHDDLLRVQGIGPKTLEKIRPYLLPESGTQTMVGTP